MYLNVNRTTNLNQNQTGAIFRNQNQKTQKVGANQDLRSLKRLLTQGAQKNPVSAQYTNIVDQSASYADSLRASRMKAKDTALKVKKLKYNFKSLSTKIMQSKTSTSAKQVASQARREVIKLKRQLQSEDCDTEEVQSAIAHAQSMERVAKKKARHLLEEEMVKVTGGPCAGELEEREDEKDRLGDDALEDALAKYEEGSEDEAVDFSGGDYEAMQEQMQAYQEMMQARMEELQWAMEEMAQQLQEQIQDSSSEMMDEMMAEMSDSMKEMLENSGLEDLADSMFATTEAEVDPADYKMMKIKHRSEEMKALAKADSEYLKAMFDRLEKLKGSGGAVPTGASGGGISFGGGGGEAMQPISMPEVSKAIIAEPSETGQAASGGVDVFV